jgi:hypothetical protein
MRTKFLWSVLLLSGCQSYLLPPSHESLPTRTVSTRGGDALEANDGELFLHVGAHDIATALGVALEESGGGVFVVNRLRDDTELRAGDRIVHVSALSLDAERLALKLAVNESNPITRDERLARVVEERERTPLTRMRAENLGTPVRGVHDLQGYTAGYGWAVLDLGVERAGEEIVCRAWLKDRRQRLTVTKPPALKVSVGPLARHDLRDWARYMGVELTGMSEWPSSLRPTHAAPEDHVVSRIERDSPAALAGLRPLDVITRARSFVEESSSFGWTDYDDLAFLPFRTPITASDFPRRFSAVKWSLTVRSADGGTREIDAVKRTDHTDFWIPFVLSLQSDGTTSHFGLGPLDMIFHHSARKSYDPETDVYGIKSRVSFLTAFHHEEKTSPRGGPRWLDTWPIADRVRGEYSVEWAEGKAYDLPRIF